MDRSDFAHLFHEAVRRALQQADLPDDISEPLVEYCGEPNPPACVSVDQALDFLWLSGDKFYRIVDVAAFGGESNPPIVFVRPAGFELSSFDDTWEPTGLGPFKVTGPVIRGRG